MLSGDDNKITQFPHDFQLFCLGEFDIKSGNIAVNAPNMIMTGVEAVQVANKYRRDSVNAQNALVTTKKKGKVKNVDSNKDTGNS